MIIYLVRHGETEWNAKGRFQGREDIALNENGRKQAMLLAGEFAGKNVRSIISSPLKRAAQTADIINTAFPHAERRSDERLTERDLGGLSGLTKPERIELREQGPIMDMEPLGNVMRRMYEALCDADTGSAGIRTDGRRRQYEAVDSLCPAEDESTADITGIVTDTMKYGGKWYMDPSGIDFRATDLTADEKEGECIILVSHGAAINALLSMLSGGKIGSGKTILRNIAISIVREEPEGFMVMDYDITDKI